MRRHCQLATLSLSLVVASLLANFHLASAIEPQISVADQKKIDAAIPDQAIAKPQKPRKLLIFGLNVGYPGHGSIRHANYAFSQMGKKTGAFEAVVSNDPELFRPETLSQFDAVFFNNNVGNLFQDPELRQSLVEFIYSGGGMLGVHGTTVAFTQWPGAIEDWPEFGRMIGGRGANHKNSDEHVVVKLDDPANPLNAPFGGNSFDYRDEFFRVHDPYSRNRVRVLLSIDTDKTDMTQGGVPRGRVARADNDYALAWIRNYGRGRTFYCTIAHNPYVFWDPKMLEFYLGAIQFALGDLPAPTTPSAQLTPGMRAQEQLGWRLELAPATAATVDTPATLFETIDLAAQSKLGTIAACDTQLVSQDIPCPFDHTCSDEALRQVRLRLDDAGVRLFTYSLAELPKDASEARRVFQLARTMGVEMVRIDKLPESLDSVVQLVQEFELRISSPSTPSNHGSQELLTAEQRLYIGHDIDLLEWVADDLGGIVPMRRGPNRIFTCVMPRQPVTLADGSALSPIETQRRLKAVLQMLANPELKPVVVRIAVGKVTPNTQSDIAAAIELFDRVCLELK